MGNRTGSAGPWRDGEQSDMDKRLVRGGEGTVHYLFQIKGSSYPHIRKYGEQETYCTEYDQPAHLEGQQSFRTPTLKMV